MSTILDTGAVLDGKYRLLRRIGEGGMGTVFEGENVRIRRKVAIKVLHEHVATSPEFAQRFVREARASARIGSEHVCDVLDLGDLENGEKYIVMELLDGESLEDKLERDLKMTAADLAPVAFQMLDGLGAMHHVGVVHRDLKPANVFLCKGKGGDVSVKILDFGVAKIEASDEDPSGVHDMTTTGTMMGTPLYMSPEQARGARDVDGRTDLYAASVIFYRALTGEVPHHGTSLHELLFKIVLDEPKAIRDLAPEVDDELARIVMKGLSRDPEKRYPSARTYQEDIVAWGKDHGFDFRITLPSEPPLLRKVTGGFPAAQIELAAPAIRSGNTPVSVDGRKSAPAITPDAAAIGVADTQPSRAPEPPQTMQSPAASTMGESPSLAPKPAAGDTLVAGGTPKEPAAAPPPPPTRPSPPEPAKATPEAAATPAPVGSSMTMYIVGGVIVVASAILGMKLGIASKPPEPEPAPSVSVSAPPSAPPPPASTPAAIVPVVPSESAAPSVSAPPAPPPPAAPHPNVAPPPKPSPAPPPTPAPAISGRVIRTDAGF
ncbi:MAG: serine/threonine protein kinase [Labilithrix sp.]|nr:serine/threonine protein kinase [Labilithrix sp.]MCW5814177.1 serine/threonine protein kinase [Labilithrix sp.]